MRPSMATCCATIPCQGGRIAATWEARTMDRLTRLARGVVVAVVLALVVAGPAAAATRPTRTVFEPHAFVIPAGQGCSFDIRFVPTSGFAALTVYSENEWRKSVHVKVTNENI